MNVKDDNLLNREDCGLNFRTYHISNFINRTKRGFFRTSSCYYVYLAMAPLKIKRTTSSQQREKTHHILLFIDRNVDEKKKKKARKKNEEILVRSINAGHCMFLWRRPMTVRALLHSCLIVLLRWDTPSLSAPSVLNAAPHESASAAAVCTHLRRSA